MAEPYLDLEMSNVGSPQLLSDSDGAADPQRDHSTANWYALYTMPKHERTVGRFLEFKSITHFLPVCERLTKWRNRQEVLVKTPLFPRYLFAKFARKESGVALRTPGVLNIVTAGGGPAPIPAEQIEWLRDSVALKRVTPYASPAIGDRVRVKNGQMAGVEGILIRESGRRRLVFAIQPIGQNISIEVHPCDVEML